MPNLFPASSSALSSVSQQAAGEASSTVKFGRSSRFDYSQGDFVMSASGKMPQCADTEAWLEWCYKALRTQRYTFLAYSRNYGHEFEELLSRKLTKEASEMEIARITTETLKVDPRTADVGPFIFRWEADCCLFQCQISNVRGHKETITERVVMN